MDKHQMERITVEEANARKPDLPQGWSFLPLVFLDGKLMGLVLEAVAGCHGIVRRTFYHFPHTLPVGAYMNGRPPVQPNETILDVSRGHADNGTEDRWHGNVEIYRAGITDQGWCLFDDKWEPDYQAYQRLALRFKDVQVV